MKNRICVIGTGYVGMATAIGCAVLGHRVIGYDILPERIRMLASGRSPYHEAGIEESLQTQLRAKNLSFSEDLQQAVAHADFVVVCVGTPARDDGSADLRDLYSAALQLDATLADDATIVLRSTVPPGTTERVGEILAPRKVIYAPEFLREGSALFDFLHPHRIVIGSFEQHTARDYASLFAASESPFVFTTPQNAELIKSASNAFLAMKVTFANQIANICDKLGADALAVLEGVGQDARIGSAFLAPGIGFGGPCFEKDVKSLRYVARGLGASEQLFDATLQINDLQPMRVIELLELEIGAVQGKTIGVWGLAFKAGTDDTRDSMALRVVELLIGRGASVVAHDPQVSLSRPIVGLTQVDSALGAACCDALMILTEWTEYRELALDQLSERVRSCVVIDGRNILDPIAANAAGLLYRGLGRASLRCDHPLKSLA